MGFHKEGEHWEFSPDIIQYHAIPYNTMQYRGSTRISPQTCSINCLSESLKGTSPKTIPPPVEIVSIVQVKCQFNLKRPHSLERLCFYFLCCRQFNFLPPLMPMHTRRQHASGLFWICFSFQKVSWHFLIKMNVKC